MARTETESLGNGRSLCVAGAEILREVWESPQLDVLTMDSLVARPTFSCWNLYLRCPEPTQARLSRRQREHEGVRSSHYQGSE
jgi:hypothetical protein